MYICQSIIVKSIIVVPYNQKDYIICKRRYYTYVNSNDPTIISNTIFTIFIKFDIDNYNNIKIIYIYI